MPAASQTESALRTALMLVWVALAAWTAIGALAAREPFRSHPPLRYADVDLYAQIVGEVERGQSYYAAANRLQRQHSYPVRPFYTTRLPTLAWTTAAIGPVAARAALIGVLILTVLAWRRALAEHPRAVRLIAPVLIVPSGIAAFGSNWIYLHEIWAGVLMSLAFATRDKWPVSLGFAGLALFVRELAMPYVLLALGFALWHRRWREAAAWGVLIAVFAAAMTLHANATLTQPVGQSSPGWLTVRGPLAVFQGLSEMPPFIFIGLTLTPIVALLALLGWTRAPGEQGLFGAALMIGYLCAFTVFGRGDNTYWTVLLLPTLLLGLAFLRFKRGQPPQVGSAEHKS